MDILEGIGSIRLRDLQLFHEVSRAKSIREAGRRMGLTSSQVSKGIQGLESRLGVRLFKRSVSGVLLTSAGGEFLGIAQELINGGQKIEWLLAGQSKTKIKRTLAIAGTAFLTTHLVTKVVCAEAKRWPETSFRFLDLAPDQMVSVGLRGAFELCIHFGKVAWPSTWTTETIGRSPWALVARADHPLSRRPKMNEVLEYPFVVPTYWTAEGLVQGNDQFPIPFSKRKMGFETATADAAIPVMLNSDHLAFLPTILVNGMLHEGKLRALTPPGLQIVERELFFSARADAVPSALFRDLTDALKENLP